MDSKMQQDKLGDLGMALDADLAVVIGEIEASATGGGGLSAPIFVWFWARRAVLAPVLNGRAPDWVAVARGLGKIGVLDAAEAEPTPAICRQAWARVLRADESMRPALPAPSAPPGRMGGDRIAQAPVQRPGGSLRRLADPHPLTPRTQRGPAYRQTEPNLAEASPVPSGLRLAGRAPARGQRNRGLNRLEPRATISDPPSVVVSDEDRARSRTARRKD